jgi:hypothetical protein
MRRGAPFNASVAIALALHALAFIATRSLIRHRSILAEHSKPVDALIWIDAPDLAPDQPDEARSAASAADPLKRSDAVRASTGAKQLDDALPPSVKSALPSASPAADGEPAAAAETETTDGSSGPTLSRAQLGIGTDNPFLTRGGAPGESHAPDAGPSKRERAIARFQRTLVDATARDTQAHGLGPEGPVLRTLEADVYASSLPLDSNALFFIETDSEGRITDLNVSESASDARLWLEVAERTRAALKNRKLKLSPGTGGVRMQIRVSTREQLPSGADPGLDVNILGIPVKKSGKQHAASLNLLSPNKSLNPLSLNFDPVDIGAQTQRMVHARLVAFSTKPAP